MRTGDEETSVLGVRRGAPVLVEVERAEGGIRVEAIASGISRGTELRLLRGESPFGHAVFDGAERRFRPGMSALNLGYQLVGRVTQTVPGGPRVGALVHGLLPHGRVHEDVESRTLEVVPDGVPATTATLLVPTQIALNAVHDARPLPGERILVIGTGVIGLLVVAILRHYRYDVIVATSSAPGSAAAVALGADVVRVTSSDEQDDGLVEAVKRGGIGADSAIEVAGTGSAIGLALRTLRVRGRLVVVGFHNDAGVNVSFAREWHHNALEMVSSKYDWGCGTGRARWSEGRLASAAWELLAHGIGDFLAVTWFEFGSDFDAVYSDISRAPQLGYGFKYK